MAVEERPPTTTDIVNSLRRKVAELERRVARSGGSGQLGAATGFTGMFLEEVGGGAQLEGSVPVTIQLKAFDDSVFDTTLWVPILAAVPGGD